MWSQKFVGYVFQLCLCRWRWDLVRTAMFRIKKKRALQRCCADEAGSNKSFSRGHDLPICQLANCNSAAQGRQIDRLGATIFSSLKLYNGDHFEPSQRILETGGCWRSIGSRGRFVAWWEFPTCSLWHRFAGGQSKASDFAQSETSEANCCSSFWGQNRRVFSHVVQEADLSSLLEKLIKYSCCS